MKTLVFSFVLCLLFGLNYAQSTYYPLIETGKTWHVMEGGLSTSLTFTYKVEGDTLINQEDFKFLYRSNEEFPVNWTKYGYIREDEDKKVYYSPYHVNDTLIDDPAMVYNFGAELYDTMTITSFAYNYPTELEIVISSIDSVLIGDDYRKRFNYQCEQFIDNFWIEGIGSNNGLLEPGFYCYIVCPVVELLCVKEEGNVIAYDSSYSWYWSGREISSLNLDSIFESFHKDFDHWGDCFKRNHIEPFGHFHHPGWQWNDIDSSLYSDLDNLFDKEFMDQFNFKNEHFPFHDSTIASFFDFEEFDQKFRENQKDYLDRLKNYHEEHQQLIEKYFGQPFKENDQDIKYDQNKYSPKNKKTKSDKTGRI